MKKKMTYKICFNNEQKGTALFRFILKFAPPPPSDDCIPILLVGGGGGVGETLNLFSQHIF